LIRTLSAKLVRDVRKRLGLTQEKFASRIGVAFPTVSRWENGRTVPSPLAFHKLEEVVRELADDGADLLEKYFTDPARRG
jgi:putative transcriptional regulator